MNSTLRILLGVQFGLAIALLIDLIQRVGLFIALTDGAFSLVCVVVAFLLGAVMHGRKGRK